MIGSLQPDSPAVWLITWRTSTLALPLARELRPVLGDRGVEVELAAVGEHQAGQRGHRLRRRPDVDDRVRAPTARSAPSSPVDRAAPQVDDQLAVDRHGDRRADVGWCRRSSKLPAKASRTAANRSSHVPGSHAGRSPIARDAVPGMLARMSIFEHPINTLAGEPSSLADRQGQPLLIVNVASKCGLTPQYTGLEELQQTLRRPRLHRPRLPVQPVRRPGAGHRRGDRRRSARRPTA